MNADAVLYAVGEMLDRNQREEVDLGEVKKKFDAYVRDLAAGRTPKDLTVEEVWVLGAWDGCCADLLPPDVAEALGLEPQTTYGDAVLTARDQTPHRKVQTQ